MRHPSDRSTASGAIVLDAALRVTYRLAFKMLRAWWCLRRPDHRGALVAIWLDGQILMVRQSYRTTLSWPGGGIRRYETPRDAALRELREELGLVVSDASLSPAMDMTAWWDCRRDHVWIFELTLGAVPRLRLDNREIVEACFMAPAEVLDLPVSPFIRRYLVERVRGQ